MKYNAGNYSDGVSFETQLKNYINFISKLTNKFVCYVNIESVNSVFRFHLKDKEYDDLIHLLNGDNSSIVISNELKHPTIRKSIYQACNNVIYVGYQYSDHYLSFNECNNFFIHGQAGSGKTFLLSCIYQRLEALDSFKKINIYIWSNKPFEWKTTSVVNDPLDLYNLANKQYDGRTIIIIDELADYLSSLNKEQKELFISFIRNGSANNITFICASQRMNNLISDIDSIGCTKACMMCASDDEYYEMLGEDINEEIKEIGDMYLVNSNLRQFKRPKLLGVNPMMVMHFYSRFGAHFIFSKIPNNSILVDCYELGFTKKHVSIKEFEELKISDQFDISDKSLLKSRLRNIEYMYNRELRLFDNTHDTRYLERANQILKDLKVIKGEK